MLRPRIIPCLLLHEGGLVKTTQFSNPKYVGDPLNAVRIFNEKEVDELIVLDIDASVKNNTPNYVLISKLAGECRMPLCYGGGIKTVEQVEKIISLGVEKVALNSAAIDNPLLIYEASKRVGSQSIVVSIDVKKKSEKNNSYSIYTHNSTHPTCKNPVDFIREVEALGAGEILVNSIDNDGTLSGYDLELIDQIHRVVTIPMTVLGGASSFYDFSLLFKRYGIIGVSAGSVFVFKGKFRAVLIQYPSSQEKEIIISSSLI